jgi:AraC-like DNA-binding protein
MLTRLASGGYSISDEITIPGEGASNFIFGRGWLLEVVELAAGDFFFYSDGKEVRPAGNRFAAFYPPFTFVRAYARNIRGSVEGVGSEDLPDGLPTIPIIFTTDFAGRFECVEEALDLIVAGENKQSIEVNSKPGKVSLSTKRLIDDNYLIYPSIVRIAKRLGVSHEHLSRQFKRDYGLTPSAYLHQLRIADATHRLSLGEEIIDISMGVGYNDLSRFYKQFRKATRTSPAICREMLNR